MLTRSRKRGNSNIAPDDIKTMLPSLPKKFKVSPSLIQQQQPSTESEKKMYDPEVEVAVKKESQSHSESSATTPGQKFVGAHVSVAGGLYFAPQNAAAMGAKSFALFVRSQRRWDCKALDEEDAEKFRKECQIQGYTPDVILPHGSYLLNCGAPDSNVLQKSRDAILDELQRCEKLGLNMYNFHPGSTCGKITVEECLDRIGETINLVHEKTKYIITVIENMSCQGHTVGGDFKELKSIIDRVKDKARVGVCLDTCHAFAAGYDLASEIGFNKMMDDFESLIGLKYLKALHLNDSKGKVNCHLDRHEIIGKGYIGKEGFKRIMNDSRFNNMPMILETPYVNDESYAEEIRLLYSFESEK